MSSGRICFITGQIVKTVENKVFAPGQTTVSENDTCEYIPGITCEYIPGITFYIANEPISIPGLVTGEEEQSLMILSGEEGQLVFQATEEDYNPGYRDVPTWGKVNPTT